jgi:hypothetical protein
VAGGIDYRDCLEKSELVERLQSHTRGIYTTRAAAAAAAAPPSPAPAPAPQQTQKKKKKKDEDEFHDKSGMDFSRPAAAAGAGPFHTKPR